MNYELIQNSKFKITKVIQKTKFSIALLALAIAGCSSNIEAPEESQIIGLATPIGLDFGQTEIIVEDYFISDSLIDSVTVPRGLQASISSDKSTITLTGSIEQPLEVMEIWAEGYAYHFLLKRSNKQEVTITYDSGNQNVSSVKMKGR